MTSFLLEWAVSASFLILAVTALRALVGRRVSAGLRYALWAVVLVRLLVPFQLFSLPVPAVLPEMDRDPIAASAAPAASPVLQEGPVGVPAIAAPPPSGVAVNYEVTADPSAVTPSGPRPWDVLGWLWLAGTGVMAAAFLLSNLVFALRLRRVRVPLEGADCPLPVYVALELPSPCLFGLARPAVYLTPATAADPDMLRHILAHEYTHFRHGDHIWNALRGAALAIHWWNPLVWLAVALSRRDCELACDEGALKRLGEGERIAYGRTLLALITAKPRPGDLLRCSTTMTGGQKSVFDRVSRIARAPKRWLWAAVAAVIAASLACVCAFGMAAETGDGAGPDFAPSAPPLESELNLSMDENGNVAITGTIDGLTLGAGTCWQPVGAPAHTLMMPYAPFDEDDADGYLQAQWNGDNTVLMWSRIMTEPSSDPDAGFWTFSVDLSGEQAVVTDMSSLPSSPEGTDPDMKLRLYPESISDEEAVRAARIAAKLLTAAEDYYNNYTADVPYLYTALLGGAPFYSVDAEKTLTFDTIDGVLDPDGVGYEITRYASVDFDGDGAQELILYVEQQGAFNFILHEMDGELYAYCCGVKSMQIIKTDGTFYNKYAAECAPESDGLGGGYCKVSFTKTGLELHPFSYEVNLPSREDGSDSNYRLVVDGQPADSQTFEAAEAAQNAKPDVVWYEFRLPDSEDLYAALPELYAKVLRGESRFVLYQNEPPVSIDEVPAIIDPYDAYMCLQRYAVVDLLGGLGSDQSPQVLAYFCGVAGDMAGYLLLWDEDGQVHGEIFDHNGWRNRWFIDLKTDGTFECTDALGGHWWSSISCLRPTAAGSWTLYSQAVLRGLDDSGQEIDLESFMTIEQELTEREFEQALEVQRVKPDVTWYGGFPLKGFDGGPVPTQPIAPIELDPSYHLDELGTYAYLEGLDCGYARWFPARENHYSGQMEEAYLTVYRPRFLSQRFFGDCDYCDAGYITNPAGQVLRIQISQNYSTKFVYDVNLSTNTVRGLMDRDQPFAGELLACAQALDSLYRNAEDFYASATDLPIEEGPLPFDTAMKLWFGSGAGAWNTILTLHPNGSFEGNYHDTDMGSSGPGYQSTKYVCQFHGRFGEIRQVTGASWSMTLEELALDTERPMGVEWIEAIETGDGYTYNLRYISSGPYGFDTRDGEPLEPGARFMFYTPDASGYRPTDELYGFNSANTDYDSLMYRFWTWMPSGSKIGAWGWDTRLGCYALCSVETGHGFFDLHAWGIT